MARGEETGNHPGRQVGKEWYPINPGDQTGPMGTVTARNWRPDQSIDMASWSGPSGHHAEVEQRVSISGEGPYSGIEHNRYVAGPFRTPARAQIAAESLANRAESNPYDKDAAGTARYENDSYTEYGRRRR